MLKRIESQMKKKGYVKVKGTAIINDIAIAITSKEVLSPTLSTKQAVDIFNNESGPGWALYRKASD